MHGTVFSVYLFIYCIPNIAQEVLKHCWTSSANQTDRMWDVPESNPVTLAFTKLVSSELPRLVIFYEDKIPIAKMLLKKKDFELLVLLCFITLYFSPNFTILKYCELRYS